MPGHRRYRSLSALTVPVAISAAMAVAGCGSAVTDSGRSPQVTDVVVAAVPGEGSAGLYVAQDQGLFTRAGLHVAIKAVSSSGTVIPAMLRGQVTIASGQYTSYVAADAAGVARMKILAAGYSLGPGVQEIMVSAGSPVRSPAQLKGATIAVNAVNSETTDLLYTALASYGIIPSQVGVVAIPFPAMPAALAAHRVTAIYEIQPYVTEAGQQHGDQELLDIDSGAAAGFPISGYAALASWATHNPAAARAFTRAIEQGNALAATNLKILQHAFETSLHISPLVADVMAAGVFPVSIDPTALQRVPDLMLTYGQLRKPFAITALTGR